MRPKLKKRATPEEHEAQEVQAHRESIAEDERTHGEIDSMKKMLKRLAKKKKH